VLRVLHEQIVEDELTSEALKKAAVALSLGFIRGQRGEIEDHYTKLDLPLSEEERIRLMSMGINSDDKRSA